MLVLTKKRKDLGWSQSELSRRAGMHVSSMCAIERGRLIAWPGQRRSIAEALDWPLDRADELFEEIDQ